MENNCYKQRGNNDKYPLEVLTWKLGEDVPDWLSDLAKIGAMDANTNKVSLETRNTNQGGYELLDSSGQGILLKTKNKTDLICKDTKKSAGGLFVLSLVQFNLIYDGRQDN